MSMKKKLVGMLASLALVVGLVPTAAFAADDASLTVTANEGNRTLELYQVFKGDYDANSQNLSNVVWGSSITDSATFVNTYLKGTDADQVLKDTFGGLTTTDAASVAALLTPGEDTELAIAFANAVGKYLGDNPTPVAELTSGAPEGGKFSYKFENLAHGYYLVKDATTNLPEGSTNSRFIVQVAGAAQADIKTSGVPTLTKKITQVDNSNGAKRDGKPESETDSSVGIGDTVHFELSTTIPDMTGYTEYQYMVEDTMSEGLTYNQDSLQVYFDLENNAGAAPLVEGVDYQVDFDQGTNKVQIYFLGFLDKYKDQANKKFTFRYTAKVNENAQSGNVGEENAAHLVYSRNPGSTATGEDKPDPNNTDVVGKTPDEKTYVYTTEITIKKTDKEGNTLTGAEFKLTGTNLLTTSVTIKNTFAPSDTGAWYKLTDGTYTQTAPAPGTEDKYEKKPGSTTDYQMYEATQQKTSVPADGYAVTATVDESGNLTFKGLLPGDYTLTETKAPDGYNKLANDITFTVGYTGPVDPSTACTWSITNQSQPITENLGQDQKGLGTFNITIENSPGSSLPSTGSIGTVLFYLIGGVLMIGAVAFFITKRRVARKL